MQQILTNAPFPIYLVTKYALTLLEVIPVAAMKDIQCHQVAHAMVTVNYICFASLVIR